MSTRAVTALSYVKRPHIDGGHVNPRLTQKPGLNCATKIELAVIGVVLIQISRCLRRKQKFPAKYPQTREIPLKRKLRTIAHIAIKDTFSTHVAITYDITWLSINAA